jgi:hypothetical protein
MTDLQLILVVALLGCAFVLGAVAGAGWEFSRDGGSYDLRRALHRAYRDGDGAQDDGDASMGTDSAAGTDAPHRGAA